MTYNPMSKEFQDECKKLGLTGRQLTEKYRKEGKSIKKDELKDIEKKPKENYKNCQSKPRGNYIVGSICYKCIEENRVTDNSILRPKNANREIDINGNETGKWLCKRCKSKNYNDLPDSYKNILKAVRSCRTGNHNQNHEIAKADLTQELTVRWRSTVSTIPIEDLNKKLGHNTPIDHSRDSELGIIQTQGRILRNVSSYTTTKGEVRYYEGYGFTFIADQHKEFDHMICYCIDKDNNISEVYIFPKKEVLMKTGTTIMKDHLRSIWQEKYRIKDEETIRKINEIWKQILKEKCLII